MPLRVDHVERRVRLAEAVWRIVAHDGVAGASVRGVAREANLSMGSVRHFFGSQDELLQFAMREVIVRASKRVAAQRAASVENQDPLDVIAQRLEHVLPLDEERLTEARIWMAFTAHCSQQPGLAAIRREADEEVRRLCRNCLIELGQLRRLAARRDLDVETERLWALLDGLTTHVVINAEHTSPALASTVLRMHLAGLAR